VKSVRSGRLQPALHLALLLVASSAFAQAPVINAKVEMRTAARSVADEMQAVANQGTPVWAGYRVPMVRRSSPYLQYTGTRGNCRLEPPTELVVLARFEAKTLVEVRPVSVDCDVDAAGMPLIWLSNVNPDQSVTWLASLVSDASAGRRSGRILDPALNALGLHAASSAGKTLIALARQADSSRLRGQALMFLGQRAGEQAGPVIVDAIARDPEIDVKRRAVMALAQLPRDEGIPLLINVARTHASSEVRRQAMQSLGQTNDPRALDFFEQVLLK
jgi:hypothetical protein